MGKHIASAPDNTDMKPKTAKPGFVKAEDFGFRADGLRA